MRNEIHQIIMLPSSYSEERTRYALSMRKKGTTLKSIGIELGVSKERVRQMVAKEERRITRDTIAPDKTIYRFLPTRIRNALRSNFNGLEPPIKFVRQWVNDGTINKIPNIGGVSIQIITEWLDVIDE